MLARLAQERVAREQAAAELQSLRSLAAVAGLVFGKDEGRRNFLALEDELRKQTQLNSHSEALRPEATRPRGRKRI